MPITVPIGFRSDADPNPGVVAESNTASSSAPAVTLIRACTNCVRAKAKCSSVEIGAKCERCYILPTIISSNLKLTYCRCERMKKDCQPSPSVRKRRTVKRVHTSRTSKIEQKLDGLVQLLESAAKPATTTARVVDGRSASSTSPNAFLPSLNNASDITESDYTHNNPVANARVGYHSLPTPASLSESASLNLQPAVQSNWELSIQDAELNLDKFRTDFIKHLPFVIIPHSMTAQQLRQERPILWLCIMALATNQATQQIKFSRELRTTFGQEALVEGRKSMDLLLAILVYATWYDIPITSPVASNWREV
jgi:hypothetical protein